MLRITTVEILENKTTIALEGRVVGSWAEELRRMCETVIRDVETLILDFSKVTFIDDAGLEVLKTLAQSRVHMVGCSLFLKELLRRKLSSPEKLF